MVYQLSEKDLGTFLGMRIFSLKFLKRHNCFNQEQAMNEIELQIERVLAEREVLVQMARTVKTTTVPAPPQEDTWDRRHRGLGKAWPRLRDNETFSSRGDIQQELRSVGGTLTREITPSLSEQPEVTHNQ